MKVTQAQYRILEMLADGAVIETYAVISGVNRGGFRASINNTTVNRYWGFLTGQNGFITCVDRSPGYSQYRISQKGLDFWNSIRTNKE